MRELALAGLLLLFGEVGEILAAVELGTALLAGGCGHAHGAGGFAGRGW